MADDIKNHDDEIKILLAALLWIRNHYDVTLIQGTGKTRKEVVARIDRVIMDHAPISGDDLKAFRRRYPHEVLDE